MKIYQKIQKLNPHITIPLLLASLLFVISSCSSAAAVVDVVTPSTGVTVLDCPTSFAREIVGKGTTSPVTWTPPTATDSDGLSLTGAVTYSPQADYTNGEDFPIGDTTVSYTFTDDATPPNSDTTCTFTVTVSQPASTSVTISDCPDDIRQLTREISATVTWVEPTALDSNDNPVAIPSQSHNPGDVFPLGDTEVTYTFTDDASPSNTETCTFTVTIEDGLMKTYEFYLANDALDPAATNPFLIETRAELASLASLVNDESTYTPSSGTASLYAAAAYRLENSLDLSTGSGYTHTPIGDCKTARNIYSNPCGDSDDIAFTGTFDGNSNTLSNLTYSNAHKGLGLFSVISGATISDLTLMDPAMSNTTTDANHTTGALVGTSASTSVISNVRVIGGTINGKESVGGLVGSQSSGGTITASSATGAVSGSSQVGGLVGYQTNGTITASYATGAVSGSSSDVGGLVGYQSGSITDSSASGAVSGSSNYVGGLVGAQFSGTITASSASGAVSGSSNYVGGLVGAQFSGTITASSATGAVSGSSQVGGLVGYQSDSITASYATGAVMGTSLVGGLVGRQVSGGTITASYWDTQTTGQTSSAGGGTGYRTAQLQVLRTSTNLYATWTTPPWTFMAGAYPTLSP